MSLADSSGTSSVADESWISWYLSSNGNHVLCEVDRQFIEDSFNLFGLRQFVSKNFNKALGTILDRTDIEADDDSDINASAALLYGLIHARFIITPNGLLAMQKKYLNNEFGECPRAYCQNQPVLPTGLADEPNLGCYKLFCPKCRELYHCPQSQRHVDGANFGTAFAHIFLMTYDELVPPVPTSSYVPRVYGFKIHSSSSSLPKKVVVLDANSQSEEASASNHLNSSGDSGERGRVSLPPGDAAASRSMNVTSRSAGHAAPGVSVVYDLTSEPLPPPGSHDSYTNANGGAGHPRLSLQHPAGSNGNATTTMSSNSYATQHAQAYQNPYQHAADLQAQQSYPPDHYYQAASNNLAPPQYSAQLLSRQQEYPPQAYYDALARHNGNAPSNSHTLPQYSPQYQYHASAAAPPLVIGGGPGGYNEYGQLVSYGYSPGPPPPQGYAHSPRDPQEDHDPSKRPRTHF